MAALLAALVVALAPVHVTLHAGGPSPKIGAKWWYTVHATRGGKPVAGKVTSVIVDPLGQSHPVQYGSGKRNTVNIRFRGTFRDYLEWPADARGIPLTLRVTVKVGKVTRVLEAHVVPRR
jgi:hypothetical protein